MDVLLCHIDEVKHTLLAEVWIVLGCLVGGERRDRKRMKADGLGADHLLPPHFDFTCEQACSRLALSHTFSLIAHRLCP